MPYTFLKTPLALTTEDVTTLQTLNTTSVTKNIYHYPGNERAPLTPLMVALFSINNIYNIDCQINSYAIGPRTYSNARLSYNGTLNYNIVEATGTSNLEKYLHTIITEKVTLPVAPIAINIIEVSSGITNLSKLMAANKIPEINLPLQQTREHILRIYKIQNNVYIITNKHYNAAFFYKKLTGCIPILYNDILQNIKETQPDLFNYFEKCYTEPEDLARNSDIYEIIKNATFFKSTKKSLKTKKVTKLLANIEACLKENVTQTINDLKNNITDLETRLQQSYKALHTQQILQTDTAIPNVELITPFLINNTDIKEIFLRQNCLCIRIIGPVDYNKETILKTIKGKSDFIKWLLTQPDLQLYWEASCKLDLTNYTINSYNNNYYHDYIPNTHWYNYNCFGDNKNIIQKALTEKDLLTAISKTITAAYQLNVYDMTVLNRLIDELTNSYYYATTFWDDTNKEFVTTSTLYKRFNKLPTQTII